MKEGGREGRREKREMEEGGKTKPAYYELSITLLMSCCSMTNEWPFRRPVSNKAGRIRSASSIAFGSGTIPSVVRRKYTESRSCASSGKKLKHMYMYVLITGTFTIFCKHSITQDSTRGN